MLQRDGKTGNRHSLLDRAGLEEDAETGDLLVMSLE